LFNIFQEAFQPLSARVAVNAKGFMEIEQVLDIPDQV
jgi:hypothetical protein